MKKLTALIAVLLLACTFVFADVAVKDLGDGTAEVTFFYGNPRASEVVIAGSWTDWQNAAEPMTKTDKGWEYTKVFSHDDELKYKFISDGNWTPDINAPDSIDDGFGGKNGLVEVGVLAAIEAAKATGDASALEALSAGKSGLRFQTWSMLGFQTAFNKEDFEVQSAGLNLKSYLKFSGDMLPNMPAYIEIALAEKDSFDNLYNKGTLEWKDGITNCLIDTIADPIYFYGGETAAATYLGHLKLGLVTPYVEYETGYKYAKMPPKSSAIWNTITDNWDAGWGEQGGYAAFKLGSALKDFGDLKLDAALIPNKTAHRSGSRYGMAAWASADYLGHKFDIQYNGAYGETFDTLFKNILEMDVIFGYAGSFGPVGFKFNTVFNQYGAILLDNGARTPYTPDSSDVGITNVDADFIDNFALQAKVSYALDKLVDVTLGYQLRGLQANLMYVNDKVGDNLGNKNSQKVSLNVKSQPIDMLSFALDADMLLTLDKAKTPISPSADNIDLFFKPMFTFYGAEVLGLDAVVDTYAKMDYSSIDKFAANSANFLFSEAGLKVAFKDLVDGLSALNVYYAINMGTKDKMFNSIVVDAVVPLEIKTQLGFGFESGTAANADNAFGIFLGASKKLSVLQKPTFYGQFVYGLDGYKGFGDGQYNLNLDDDGYRVSNGTSGDAFFRLGLHWDI